MKKQGRAERTGPAAQEAHRVYETPDDPAILNRGGTARVTAAEGWGLVIPVLRQAGMTLDRAREALIGRLAGRFTWMQAEAQRNLTALGHLYAMRDKHKLRGDDACCDGAIIRDRRSKVLFRELAREVQRLGIDPLDIAGRIDAHRQRGYEHHSYDGDNEYRHARLTITIQSPGCGARPTAVDQTSSTHPTVPRGRKTSK